MQANVKLQAKPKRVAGFGMRNFNFRCNLEEIDKIIEEGSQANKADDISNNISQQDSPSKECEVP